MLTAPTLFPPSAAPTYVILRVGPQLFALPLGCVTRALRMAACTPVPDAPAWLVGLLNLAGQSLPVLDLGRRLGQPGQTPTPAHRLLIVAGAAGPLALMVDEITEVLTPAAGLDPAPPTDGTPSVVSAALHVGADLALILDPAQLLPGEPLKAGR